MALNPRGFEVVENDLPEPPAAPQKSDLAADVGAKLLAVGLGALSKRALSALADLFFLATVASAFWLWYLTPEPNVLQIVSLSIYAAFVLAANWLVRRK